MDFKWPHSIFWYLQRDLGISQTRSQEEGIAYYNNLNNELLKNGN